MHSSRSIKLTPRGVVPSVICALSLGTPVCHPPFLACHHRPFQSPRPWRTLETPPTPLQRAALQAPAAGRRGAAASRRWGAGDALPQTPEQKYRLIYLSAILNATLIWSRSS